MTIFIANKNRKNSRGPFAGNALKMSELYAGKPARTVLWGHKLPGGCILTHKLLIVVKMISNQ